MKANDAVKKLMDVDGAVAAMIVDSETGLILAQESHDFDTDTAAAGNTAVIQAKLKTMKMLKLDDNIEDMLISLGKQLHLIALYPANQSIFGYLVTNKSGANLGMSRATLKNTMASLHI
ncbi:MAG: hypothetical protein Q9M09_04705 [Mariprofundaceae bacterium]|nr:hypothetical protein [Mariprofundaceae bacterium]